MKNAWFVNRFAAPDHSATSQILTDVTQRLAQSPGSWNIHVVASRQRYDDARAALAPKEMVGGVYIHRIWTTSFGRQNLVGRSLDYVSFYLFAFLFLLRNARAEDVIVAKTDPPLLSVVAGVAAILKRAKLVNWLQDLFPEIAEEVGVRAAAPLFEPLRRIRNWSLGVARLNFVLSEDMSARVVAYGASPNSVHITPNWAVGNCLNPVPPEHNSLRHEWGLNNKFVIGYSGNLGRVHDAGTIISAIRCLREHRTAHFLFVGGGAKLECIRQEVRRAGVKNVSFHPYQPMEALGESLSVPDVHLISLLPNLEGLVVPSKFFGILAVGKPCIFIGSKTGEIARWVQAGDCGITVETGEGKELARILLELSNEPRKCARLAANARRLYEREFTKEQAIQRWLRAFHNEFSTGP